MDSITAPATGGVYVAATTIGNPGTTAAAQQTTLAANGTTINVDIYPRFAIGCGTAAGSAEFPQGITFNADGTTTAETTPAASDLYFSGPDCTGNFTSTESGDFVHVPGGAISTIDSGNALGAFPTIRTASFSANDVSYAYNIISKNMPGSEPPIGPGIVGILETRSGKLVKFMITYRFIAFGPPNSYFISGGYEVQGQAPGDGF
jgi:hypothetical protein